MESGIEFVVHDRRRVEPGRLDRRQDGQSDRSRLGDEWFGAQVGDGEPGRDGRPFYCDRRSGIDEDHRQPNAMAPNVKDANEQRKNQGWRQTRV